MARGFTVLDSFGRIKQSVTINGAVTTSYTAGGTQNDVSFGISGNGLVRLNNTIVDLTITGISAGSDGQMITFVSVGTKDVYFKHQSASSIAANRLTNLVTSGDTPIAAGSGIATYMYDLTSTTWRLVNHDQGARLSWTPTYTASGSMTYGTVTTTTARYYLKGRLALITYDFSGTVGGTPDVKIFASLPNSWQSPAGAFNTYDAITGAVIAIMQSRTSTATLEFYSTASGAVNWAAGTQRILGTVLTEIL